MVSLPGPPGTWVMWCQARRRVVSDSREEGYGLKIPSERSTACFVWSTARCVVTLRMYHGRKAYMQTPDVLAG